MALDENDFRAQAHLRRALHRGLDVAGLVARGNDHRALNCGRAAGCGLGRATITTVTQKCGINGASQRFSNGATNGVPAGQRMRVSVLMTSQPARCSRFAMSSRDSQFCSSVGDFAPSFSAPPRIGRQRLLKKLTTSRVSAVETACNRSSTACTSGRSFTRSDRMM